MTTYSLQLPELTNRLVQSCHLPRIGEYVSFPGVLAEVREIVHPVQPVDAEALAFPVVSIIYRRQEGDRIGED